MLKPKKIKDKDNFKITIKRKRNNFSQLFHMSKD